MTVRVWLITGAASGFGRGMTERALANGEIVIATDLKPEGLFPLQSKYPSDKLLVRKLNVTEHQEIVAAFAAAKETFGRIDVVFNNAGYALCGELEGIPINDARRLLDVNFWGAAQVSLEAVKFFREVNGPLIGGRLLTTTSMLGVAGSPTAGYYCAAKFALEGFSESLVRELDPTWNIKITLIEPGVFRTGIVTAGGTIMYPVHPAYAKNTAVGVIREAVTKPDTGGDPAKAVKEMYEISSLPDPPFRLPLGKDAIARVKRKIDELSVDLERTKSRSDKLGFD